jgi:hypothetical protein
MVIALANRNIRIVNGNLHLRKLDATTSEILNTIFELKNFLDNNSEPIYSFSFSYNQNLGDEGVGLMINILPASLRSIGLVNCNIGDKGGLELLTWLMSAAHVNILCIEQNNFSSDVKNKFKELAREKDVSLFI